MTRKQEALVSSIWNLLGPDPTLLAMSGGRYNTPAWKNDVKERLAKLIDLHDTTIVIPVPVAEVKIEEIAEAVPPPVEVASLEEEFSRAASAIAVGLGVSPTALEKPKDAATAEVDHLMTPHGLSWEMPPGSIPVYTPTKDNHLSSHKFTDKTAAEYIRTAPEKQRLSAGGGSAVVAPGGYMRICGKVTSYLDPHITPGDSELAGMDMSQDLTPSPLDSQFIQRSYIGMPQLSPRNDVPQSKVAAVHVHTTPYVDASLLRDDEEFNFSGYKPSHRVIASTSDTLRYEREVGGVSDPALVEALEHELQAVEQLDGYDYQDDPTGTGIVSTFDRSQDGSAKLRTSKRPG